MMVKTWVEQLKNIKNLLAWSGGSAPALQNELDEVPRHLNLRNCHCIVSAITFAYELRLRRFKMIRKAEKEIYNFHALMNRRFQLEVGAKSSTSCCYIIDAPPFNFKQSFIKPLFQKHAK